MSLADPTITEMTVLGVPPERGDTGTSAAPRQIPRLAQEDLDYGTPEAPFVSCPNVTDKVFLPNGANGAVSGRCVQQLHYLLTPTG